MTADGTYHPRRALRESIDVWTTPPSVVSCLERLLEVDKRQGKAIEKMDVVYFENRKEFGVGHGQVQLIRRINFGGEKYLAFVFSFGGLGDYLDHVLRYSHVSICVDSRATDEYLDEYRYSNGAFISHVVGFFEWLDIYAYKQGKWSCKMSNAKRTRLLKKLGDEQEYFAAACEAVSKKLGSALRDTNEALPNLFLDLLEEWAGEAAAIRRTSSSSQKKKSGKRAP